MAENKPRTVRDMVSSDGWIYERGSRRRPSLDGALRVKDFDLNYRSPDWLSSSVSGKTVRGMPCFRDWSFANWFSGVFTEVLFSKEQFKKMMPHSSTAKINSFYEPLEKLMQQARISSPLRIAHFMSQVGKETASLLYLEEIASGIKYEGRSDLGNTQKGDGKRFKGRGLIHLTGRKNYTDFQTYLRNNFTNYSFIDITTGDENPKQLSTNYDLSVLSAIFYWTVLRPDLNKYADEDDFDSVTIQVNGGFNGYDERWDRLVNCKKILGIK